MKKFKVINNKILEASILNLFGTFLLKAIVYISIPLFTRIMDSATYGYVSTYTTYISFLGIVIGLSLNTATSNARIDFEKRFDAYNSSIIKASFAIFIGELVLGNILCNWIEKVLFINRYYLNIVFFIAYGEYVVNSYYKINTVDFKFKSNLKISISNALISLVISVILILKLKDDIIAKLIGQGSFLCVVAIIVFIQIAFIKSNNFSLKDIWYAKRIAIPNIFHQISHLIMSQSDRIFILNLCGPVTTAKYSVIYNFSLVMQMIWNAVNEVWVPWLYRMLHDKRTELIIKMSKVYLYAFTFLFIIAMLVAPDFMPVLAPLEYSDATNMIIPVLLATYFIFLYSFFVNIEIFHKKNRCIAVSTMLAALINIGGNYTFIPLFGYKAAAYTTLFSYVLLMVLHFLFLTYLFKLNIYPIKMFLPFILITVFVSILTFATLNFPCLRYLILIGILAVSGIYAYKNRRAVTAFINLIRK